MAGVYFGAMVPKTQTNQNQISQKRTHWRSHFLMPAGLYSDLMQLNINLPRSVNSSTNTSLLT